MAAPSFQNLDQAFAAHSRGDLKTAENLYRKSIRKTPTAHAHKGLGVLLCQVGNFPDGAKHLRQATTLAPQDPEAWSNLGNALLVLRELPKATTALEKALELDPDLAVAHSNLSAVLRDDARIGRSAKHAAQAVALDPNSPEARINLGASLLALGLAEEAIAVFNENVELHPQDHHAWQNLLMAVSYSPAATDQAIRDLHTQFAQTLPPPSPRPPLPNQIERVAFLSGDLYSHPVARFLLPLLQCWNHSRHHLTLVSTSRRADQTTDALRQTADRWIDIAPLADPHALKVLREAKIDLLIDLSGHTAENRLPLLSLRPAPLQAHYLGYSGTTGHPALDFLIADADAIPDLGQAQAAATETLVPLPACSYTFPHRPITRHPKPQNDPVVFGSFNNPAKISDPCLAAWARILHQAPTSLLVLKYPRFDCPDLRQITLDRFTAHGIPSDRVTLLGWQEWPDHCATLAQIDLALDTFPYNGATTTADALSVGTPVLTLAPAAGPHRFSARMASSPLLALGLPDCVTPDADTYIAAAVQYATSPETRAHLAHRLHQALATRLPSPERLAQAFQDLADTLPSRLPHPR